MVVTNDRARDESYRNALKSCDLRQCVRLLKALLLRKREREENGKKITATDERYLKAVQDELYNELALAMGTDVAEVKETVLSNCI